MSRLVALLLVLVATTGGGPAWADDRLGLSRDGVTWSAALAEPLFDDGLLWVPGDRRSASFYVRNRSGGPATLDVELVAGAHVASLLRTGDLRISTRGVGRRWTTVADPGRHAVVRSVPVPAGARHRVDVVVALAASSPNRSQRKAADLRFRVRLTSSGGAGPGGAGPGGAGPGGSGALPGTGGVQVATLVAALVLVAAGGALAAAGRRSRGHA